MMTSKEKTWAGVAVLAICVLICGFFTNGYGLFTPADPTPDPTPVAAPQVIDQAAVNAAVAETLPAAVKAELARLEKIKAETAAKLAKAKADSISEAKATREARELAAMPAKVRRLEKELAALKAAKSVPATAADDAEVNIAPAMKELQQKKAAAASAAAPTGSAKAIEVKLEANDATTTKIGLTVKGWTEYEPGETASLPAGDYAINACNAAGTWAYDWTSRSMEKPNFLVSVNGVVLETPGRDNGRGGANAHFRVNPDGTITPLY